MQNLGIGRLLFDTEDVENYLANKCVYSDRRRQSCRNMLESMREMIAGKKMPAEPEPTIEIVSHDD